MSAFLTPVTFSVGSTGSFFGNAAVNNSVRACPAKKGTARSKRVEFAVSAEAVSYKTKSGQELTPNADYVFVHKVEAATETAGGIALPENAVGSGSFSLGEVVAKGPGEWTTNEDGVDVFMPVDVSVGDHVLYVPYASREVEVGKEKFDVVPAPQLIAVVSRNFRV